MKPDERQVLFETHAITMKLDKTVNGNGRPGLKARMDRLEGAVKFFMAMVVVVGVVAGVIRAFS